MATGKTVPYNPVVGKVMREFSEGHRVLSCDRKRKLRFTNRKADRMPWLNSLS